MNILIVNQSVIDMSASFFTLLTAVVEVDGTGMSRDSCYDQFVCRIWLTRLPLWDFLVTSTYGIFLMALERYVAVIHPFWCKAKVITTILYGLAVGKNKYKSYPVSITLSELCKIRLRWWSPFHVRTSSVFVIISLLHNVDNTASWPSLSDLAVPCHGFSWSVRLLSALAF